MDIGEVIYKIFEKDFDKEKFLTASKVFLDKYIAKAKKKAILGLSGGIDSALSATLAVQALGPDNVIAVSLPAGPQNNRSTELAAELASKLGIDYLVVPIDKILDAFVERNKETLGETDLPKMRIGNAAARIRMITLFDLATKFDAIVLGTENLTEHYCGYFTLFGDQASCVEPIDSLLKTEVRIVARHFGDIIPSEIITRPPSAELFEGHTDEGELGLTYPEIDYILKTEYFVKPMPIAAYLDEKETQVFGDWVHLCYGKAVAKTFDIVEKTQFKRELPYSMKNFLLTKQQV